jgi:sortase A
MNRRQPAPAATVRPTPSALRLLERLLLATALVTLGWYGYAQMEAQLYQSSENRALDALLVQQPAAQDAPPATAPTPANGTVIGRVEIPRLAVATIIRAGADARTLQLAVGHIPGTALPGEGGNVGLAGHRDTFFRRLKDIAPDDEIRVVTPEGSFIYRVERTNVVQPEDIWVLDPTSTPVLTLITCYPFNYIGAAPDRFVVRATLEQHTAHHRRAPPGTLERGPIMLASSPRR